MKRLVSFSVAAMLAMGMTAGAVCDKPAQQTGESCKVSAQQCASTQQAFQKLCERYGLNAGKQCSAPASLQVAAKQQSKSCTTSNKNTSKSCTDTKTCAKPSKPATGETPTTTPSKPVTGETPTTTPDKPATGETTTTTPSKPAAEETSTSQSSFAAQVVSLVNAERAKQGLSALKIDSSVTAAAQTRAGEIKSSFAHTRPDGRSFSTALSEAGVSYRGAGENIAYGQSTPEEVMNAWMNSAGHRANILNNKYTTIGVGYTVIGGVAYWTQLFTY